MEVNVYRVANHIEHLYDYNMLEEGPPREEIGRLVPAERRHLQERLVLRERFCFCGNAISGTRYRFCSYRCMYMAAKASAYGIDGAQYLALVRDQGDACALCLRQFIPEVLQPVIDHDHITGRVRGLLCQGCNLRVGFFERALREHRESALLMYGNFALKAVPYLGIGAVGSS